MLCYVKSSSVSINQHKLHIKGPTLSLSTLSYCLCGLPSSVLDVGEGGDAYRSRRPEVFLLCVCQPPQQSLPSVSSLRAKLGKRERRVICTRHLRIPPKPGKSALGTRLLRILYFPIAHNTLCLPPKFCINHCF